MKKVKNKRRKLVSTALCYLLFQMLILAFLAYFLSYLKPIDENMLNQAVVKVDETYYVPLKNLKHVKYKFYFCSEGKEFRFPRFAVLGTNECSMSSLNDTINVGDTLCIKYASEKDYNRVYEVTKNGDSLRTIEGFNQHIKKQRVLTVIVFLIFELVYSVLLFISILISRTDIKTLWLKHKKKKYLNIQ